MEQAFITKTQLKERGWTDSLIKRFLVEPDKRKPNFRYGGDSEIHLYCLERVTTIEVCERFKAEKSKSNTRSEKSKSIKDQMKIATVEAAESLIVNIEIVDKNNLLKLAIENYNERNWSKSASVNDSEAFLDRIVVNYIRHCLTTYDFDLQRFKKKVGVRLAERKIRYRVFEKIKEVYPEYQNECDRQLAARSP